MIAAILDTHKAIISKLGYEIQEVDSNDVWALFAPPLKADLCERIKNWESESEEAI